MRIYYAAGPGNILGTFEHWLEGRHDPYQVAMTYSGQFFDACRRGGHTGYALGCPNLPARQKTAQQVTVEHDPRGFRGAGRLRYHAGAMRYHARQTRKALRFGAELAVISPQEYLFPYLRLKRRGVRLVPSLHCVLWPKHRRPGPLGRLILRLEARALRRCDAVMCASRDIADQVRTLCGDAAPPIIEFLPLYLPGTIPATPPPAHGEGAFRLVFAGRIVQNKGVYTLLELAQRLRDRGGRAIRFDLCGEGPELRPLREATERSGLGDRFVLHGHLEKQAMREIYQQAHAVIAPTRGDFVEGFNQVVSEAVMAGRPVVTSTVCPAIDYVRGAVVLAEPDDAESYLRAVTALAEDPAMYEEKCRASGPLASQFYDPANSWRDSLERVITALQNGARPAPREIACALPA